MALKWGIVSAGKISNDFVASLHVAPETEHQVVAVAARSKERAEEFAARFNIPRAYGSYEELAEDEDVDVAYIGAYNPDHLYLSEMMMEHKKHVLCEKPLGLNYSETLRIVQAAQHHNVFLMEAIWSRFNPIYERLRQELSNGTIGKVRQVMANFGGVIPADRVRQRNSGGGGILDIGIYNLQVALLAFGHSEPTDVQAMGGLNEDGVDIYASVLLKFGDEGVASLNYSTVHDLENHAIIIGTEGEIKICSPMWCPSKMLIKGEKFEVQPKESKYPFNYKNSAFLRYEADEVKRCIDKSLLECHLLPHAESLLIAKLRDEIRKQIGVKFDQDE